ncbi:MAG: hypothetical protein ACE5E5_02535, partial [Phycisphaerae bacterium]
MPISIRRVMLLAAVVGALHVAMLGASAECFNASAGPDIVVGEIPMLWKWGTVGGITGYSMSTDSCNFGDAGIPFIEQSTQHPIIAQNMYRVKQGRIEQIGMGWAKHTFGAAANTTCCFCDNPNSFQMLGPGCSDPYDAGTNGSQARLGPRSEINPFTGAFPWPFTWQGQAGDAIYKRLQVHEADLDPAANADALYYVEVQYITPSEAGTGNQFNNVSYRQAVVGAHDETGWVLSTTGQTFRKKAAVSAWKTTNPSVDFTNVDVPDDGRLILAHKTSDNGDGTWHYEYAIYNMNCHRSASGFSVPIPPLVTITNVGFHDVDSHSGEPFDTTDWTPAVSGLTVQWATAPFVANAAANALRWGTLYNYWFDADTEPADGEVAIDLFRPGSPDSMTAIAPVPGEFCLLSPECFPDCSLVLTGYTWFEFCVRGPDTEGYAVCHCNDF